MDTLNSESITKLPADALLDMLRREAANERKMNRRLRIGLGIFFIWLGLSVAGKYWATGKSDALQLVMSLNQALSYLLFGSLSIMDLNQRRARKKFRLALLQKLENDKRAVGSLLIFTASERPDEVTPFAIKMMKALLPSLRSDDANLLLPDQQEALVKLLRHEDKELVVVVLKALEQIGDERALVPVERLAAQTKYPEVQQAAKECLPYLQTRALEKERALTLLRPSEANPILDTLLRPASTATDNAQEQLLRPTE